MGREIDREFKKAIEMGEANKKVIALAQNWCAHLKVESFGGVGLVEASTGLPIGMRRIVCPYARAAGIAGMDLNYVAIDFYERNCVGCQYRKPVGLPNLQQLVQEKEQAQHVQEERARRAADAEAAGAEERTKKRLLLRKGRDGATSQILDILDRLDRDPKNKDQAILVETARAVGDKFDEQIQGALFDLADAGGWTRTEAALEALCIVSHNYSRLAGVALGALARGEAIHSAGSIVSKYLDLSHEPLVEAAIPAVIYLASPVFGELGVPGRPGDDEPLLATHRLFPHLVRGGIASMLRSPSKFDRIYACNAIVALIGDDQNLVTALASYLIESLQLPDDHYGREGSASDAVSRTFAQAMRFRPDEIDTILQEAITGASGSDREELFRAYEEVLSLRDAGSGTEAPLTAADRLAFQRIVDVLVQRPKDGRFQRAGFFARGQMAYHPSLVDAYSDTLLGAAVLIAGDLATPYSPLIDPRPSAVRVMEEGTRRLELTTALDALSQVVGAAAGRNPATVGHHLVQTLEHLGEDHARLRAALVVGLGTMGRNREGLAIALPSLYTAMMDGAVEVRSAAATAYSELASGFSDDLPDLVHESFLLLLSDPYVAVHAAALRGLGRVKLPERFGTEAINRVAWIMMAYSKDGGNDQLLVESVEQFVRLSRQTNTLTTDTLRLLVGILDRMGSSEASRYVAYHGRQFRGTPGYAKLLVKLLGDPGTYDSHLEDLVDELSALPAHDVIGLDKEIQTAWEVCLDRGVDLTDEILEILTVAEAWNTAVDVAQQARSRLDDTRWNRPRKLYASAREVAANLERSAAVGDVAAVVSAASEWRRVRREIERDNAENAEARDPLRGLRLPNEDE